MYGNIRVWWKVCEVGKSFGIVNLILIWWLVIVLKSFMSICGFFKVKDCFVRILSFDGD